MNFAHSVAIRIITNLLVLAVLGCSNLVAAQTVSSNSSQSDGTVRVDPLDGFDKYRGGYDITNKHYWSSAIFTGVSGYVIAILWLLAGILFGGFLLATIHCFKSRRSGKLKARPSCHSKHFHFWPFVFGVIFTILVITTTGVVLGGSAKFQSRAQKVLDIIMDTADNATETIYNTTGAMKVIRDSLGSSNGMDQASVDQTTAFLTSASQKLDREASVIDRQARKNRRRIDRVFEIVYIVTTVMISLNLIAVIALSAFGVLKIGRALRVLIVICWLLTVLCWVFFGLYFFLQKFSGDTCRALSSFEQNPYNNTLSSVLPCDELVKAQPVLNNVSAGIYNLVEEVNANISFITLCNPFSGPPAYEYLGDNCPSGTIRIRDVPEVLRPFICSGAPDGRCISTDQFGQVQAYTTSIQNLLNVYPGTESIVKCETVKVAFSLILSKHCKPLKRYARMTWTSMLVLSIIMVFLVLMWAIHAYHNQRHHYVDGSVKPHSRAADELESAAANIATDGSRA